MMDIKRERIYQLLEKYQHLLEKGEIDKKNIFEFGRIKLTYHSNSLEGNTLSELETKLVVEDGVSIGNKRVVEILEAKNHANALDYVLDLAKEIEPDQIDEEVILTIHRKILQGIDDENAGRWRSCRVSIAGSQVVLPNYIKVPILMEKLADWIKNNQDDIVKFACDLHLKFVSIHPFVDGNGRTARLLFNLVLLIKGFPIVSIRVENRERYLKSIEKAQLTEDLQDYYEFMEDEIVASLEETIE